MKAGPFLYVLVGATFLLTVYHQVFDARPLGAGGDDGRLAAIEERLGRLEDLSRETRDEARRASRAVSGARRDAGASSAASPVALGEAASGRGGTPGFATADADAIEEAVAGRIERVLERQAAEERHRDDGQWKPPIEEVARSLELAEAQQAALRDVFDRARDEVFTLLHTQRDDGTSLLDEFADALATGENGGEAFRSFFTRLATQKVPGRDQTYLAVLGTTSERVQADIESRLDERQRERFRALRIDVLDVKTGYDPVGEYVKRRLEERAE